MTNRNNYDRNPHGWEQDSRRMSNSQRNRAVEHVNSQLEQDVIDVPGPNPRNSHGIRLHPVSDLPDIYRGIFKFGVFNAVQSKSFEECSRIFIDNSFKCLYLLAPTGSGKTVLFELGIIRMLERSKASGKQVKCVYIAPTKALCSERFQDWATKFEPIGLKCCELTGDTIVFGNNAWGDAKNATIMSVSLTLCEKWDSLTRNWHDHEQILSQIQLFLVHILNETRGSTLEVVTSRMKLRGSSIRFILVSATVPNIQDVARWIGSGIGKSEPAQIFEFGEDYRPCQLTRHVVGIPRRTGQNDFQFAKILDYKLFSILKQFSVGKPILIFCSTRKGVFGTAEQLMKEFTETESKKGSLPWSHPPRIGHTFSDKRLDEFASYGIGVHHAGLSMEDRRATEQLYLNKILRILVATSTLAVGVNLPAQMVVIKGVRTFQNNLSKEYSDLDIMQMLGRAVRRPQFDKEGIAIIMCESELEQKYRALVRGNTVLESSLHLNLAEHLNSEIGLGTINDVESAKTWLRSSFLYQRIQRNPSFYALGAGDNNNETHQGVDYVIMDSIAQLKNTQLIEHVEHGKDRGKLSSTQYGEIMSKYYIRRTTMDLILALEEHANLREIIFTRLKKDPDIRFEVKKVEKTADKTFLLVQAVLGGINLNEYRGPDSQPQMEAFSIFRHIARVSRAVLDVAVVKKDGTTIKYGLELFRCLSARAWEDRAIVLRQIVQIGEKSIKVDAQDVLAEHGITSLSVLRKQSPLRIETLLNRRPPFGLDVLASVADMPQYILNIKETRIQSDGGKNPVQVDLLIECALMEDKTTNSVKPKKQRTRSFQMTAVLTLTSDLDLIDLRRIPTKALKSGKSFDVTAELKKPSQSIIVIITPDMDLIGLEDDPDFWNMTLDSGSAIEHPQTDNIEDSAEKASKKDITNGHQGSAFKNPLKKSEIKTVSDGQYECNHPCKDKSKCRHLCCREGLTEKRKPQKPQESAVKVASTVKTSSVQRLHVPSTISAATQKEKKNLRDLDSIHERAQVAQNLQLDEGKRLKLESPRPPKRGRRPPIEYNISFTELADPELICSPADFPETYSDSDDLPEAIVPIATTSQNQERSGTHYRRLEIYRRPVIDGLVCLFFSEKPVHHSLPDRGRENNYRPKKRSKHDQSNTVSLITIP
ncbi:P-loop containing nucleoside triphosphate hydrolase protein [Flammula alnicola]|nr:P-loop containing nucleoside triphosphate hydrolase protein [Flammula alnicola]